MATPDQGTHPRFQFCQRHRLDQVIVGPQVKHANPLLKRLARRKDQYRHQLPARPQAPQDIGAIETRQPEIEDGKIVDFVFKPGIGRSAIAGNINQVAGLTQSPRQSIGQQGIIFDKQYPHNSQSLVRVAPYDTTPRFR